MSPLQLIEHLDISFAAAGCTECADKEIVFLGKASMHFIHFFSEFIHSLNSTYHEVYMFLSHQAGPLSVRTPVWGNCGAISHSIQC